MKTTKLRSMLAAGGMGALALTGVFAAAPAGAEEATKHPSRHGAFAKLTDAQKQCLEDQGLTRPTSRPTSRPSQEQIKKLRAAAKECGIKLPAHPGRGGHRGRGGERFQALTQEQRDCLTNAGLTRPEGRPTPEQFQKLRDAAAQCGIDIPARPGSPGGAGSPE